MASRRMFSADVIDTDVFLNLPVSAQCLYFHLGMRADDDGFVSSPKKIVKLIGCKPKDLTLLCESGFIIEFNSGIIVIKDWKLNNYIQNDRYRMTRYKDELSRLSVVNGSYEILDGEDRACIQNVSEMDTGCIQNVSASDTQISVGKEREEKDRKGKDREEKCECNDTPPHAPAALPISAESDLSSETEIVQSESEIALDDWIAYKSERGEDLSEASLKALQKKISENIDTYGDKAVYDVIELCIQNNYKSIIWQRINDGSGSGANSSERFSKGDRMRLEVDNY